MVTVAVFGAGTVGKVHARCAAGLPGVRVKTICSRRPEESRPLADELGAAWVSEPEAVFKDPEVDLIVVAYPTHVRRELIEPALAAGKFVFCEKPLASTLAEARAIARLSDQAEGWVSVGLVVRYFWEYQTARETVRSGRLGRVGMVRASRACSFPRGHDNWYADFEQSGGVVLDLMLHDIDFLLWTFGPVERVYAKGMRYAGRPEVDYALLTLRFRSGEIAHLEGSWREAPGTFYTTLEIACADGLLEYDRRKVQPLVFTPLVGRKEGVPGVVIPEMPEWESPYLKELREVARAVEASGPPPIPAGEALRAMEVAWAALESIRSGQPVRPGRQGGAL